MQVDGAALVFAGKVPRKPLALLKALIAFGGQSVAQRLLTDALWPDDDADAAQAAFTVALHRLRKLLPRGSEAIALHDGCVSLDPGLCFSDARAFELLTAPAGAAPNGTTTNGTTTNGTSTATGLQQAVALYAGHFLADEPDAPWSISLRERADKSTGMAIGAEVAAGLLALRANDGRLTTLPAYVAGSGPGQFRGATPVNRIAPSIRPFATLSHSQFRAPGPPLLTSDAYAANFNEVKEVASATSTTRSAAQTETARFHTENPNMFWDRNLRQFATASTSLADNARLAAMLWTS